MWKGIKVGTVIPAAGKGTRMGGGVAKQFLDIGGQPMLVRTAARFQESKLVDRIIVAAPPDGVPAVRELVSRYRLTKVVEVVPGGAERQESVWNGLVALQRHDVEIVLVHDAARPLVPESLIEDVCDGLEGADAVIPGLTPGDTVKKISSTQTVQETLDRQVLRLVQTPQAFRLKSLLRAYKEIMDKGMVCTDDAGVAEMAGIQVRIVEGSPINLKITSSQDLEFARILLGETQVT